MEWKQDLSVKEYIQLNLVSESPFQVKLLAGIVRKTPHASCEPPLSLSLHQHLEPGAKQESMREHKVILAL